MNSIISLLSAEVEFVALLCPGEQLPPPCGPHPIRPAVGVVLSLPNLLLVVEDPDKAKLPGGHKGPEGE